MNKHFWLACMFLSILPLAMGIDSCKKQNASTKTTVDAKSATKYTCETDDDCLLIKAGCCGCLHGGKQVAISKTAVKLYDEALDKECVNVVCAQVISTDESCQKIAKCLNGSCALHEIIY